MEKEVGKKIGHTEERTSLIQAVSGNLGINEKGMQARINRNNALPLRENFEGELIFTRFGANALALAQGSPMLHGPRGPRPSLASATNILRISGLTDGQINTHERRMRRVNTNISSILLYDLDISASNPRSAPKGVRFSDEDIRRGIYISKKIDVSTAKALGIIYAKGAFGNGSGLIIFSAPENTEKTFENAFNFLSEGKDLTKIEYDSKALRTYLLKHLAFPLNRTERKKVGIPDEIIKLNKRLQDEFLKYYISTAITFNRGEGSMRIADISERLLKDIESMVNERVTKHSTSIRPNGGLSHTLTINTIPTMELYLLGFLNENPRIKKEVETYFATKLGKRAAPYLEKKYKNLASTSKEKILTAATIVSFPIPKQ